MKWRSLIMISILASGLSPFSNALSWSVDTHRVLTEIAVESSVLASKNGGYLSINLGFQNGVNEYFLWRHQGYRAWQWLQEGSEREDDLFSLPPRFLNHFHNPLKSLHDWDEAGLDDWFNFLPLNGLSSVLWAHRESNDWSWQRTRDYFYTALTASTEEQRQEFFARTFRGLGQQMHLVQDKAVPAHVRNDAHPVSKNRYVIGGRC